MRKLLAICSAFLVFLVVVWSFVAFDLIDRMISFISDLPRGVVIIAGILLGLFTLMLGNRRRGMTPRTSA
jgi:hypothetical protein